MINCIDQQYTVVCFIFSIFFSVLREPSVVYTSNELILSLMLSAFVKNICGNIFPHKGEH